MHTGPLVAGVYWLNPDYRRPVPVKPYRVFNVKPEFIPAVSRLPILLFCTSVISPSVFEASGYGHLLP